METYIIKTMSGSIIEISEEKYEKIRMLTKGLVHLESGVSFNLSSVDSIIPKSDYILEKSDKNIGYAREDGAKLVKQFGVWKWAEDTKLTLDMDYYRSVAEDNLMSEEEYKQYKTLPENERLKMLPQKRVGRELKQVGGHPAVWFGANPY